MITKLGSVCVTSRHAPQLVQVVKREQRSAGDPHGENLVSLGLGPMTFSPSSGLVKDIHAVHNNR